MNLGMLSGPIGNDRSLRRRTTLPALVQRRIQGNSDTAGQQPTSNWLTRQLNTIVDDPDELVTKLLPSGDMHLRAGRYRARGRAFHMNADAAAIRFATASGIVVIGQSSYTVGGLGSGGAFVMSTMEVHGEFELLRDELVALQAYHQSDYGGSWHTGIDVGIAAFYNVEESVEIWRLSP